MIELDSIRKSYKQGKEKINVLNDISLTVDEGTTVAIVGPSGSGKSTLLSIMAGLDVPDAGTVRIDGVDVSTLQEKELAHFRNKKMSIVFQSFELISFFTAYENSELALLIRNEASYAKVKKMMENLGIDHRMHNLPSELSGGEQQRVAIARALLSGSKIIFADEPTGNLDVKTGKKILQLFLDTAKHDNKTLIIITHDQEIAHQMDIVYELQDGKLTRKEM
jgi:putative ABC transport system ATP-binding protein